MVLPQPKGLFFFSVAVGTQRGLEPLRLVVLPQPKVFFFLPLSAKVAVGTQRSSPFGCGPSQPKGAKWLWELNVNSSPLAVVLQQPKGLFFFQWLWELNVNSSPFGCGTSSPFGCGTSTAKGAKWLWELNVDSSPFGCGNFQSEGGSLFSFLTTEPLTELDVNLAWEISTARGFFFLSHDRATQLWERGLSFTVRNFEPEPICTRTGFRNPFKNVAGEISRKGRKHKTAGSYGS